MKNSIFIVAIVLFTISTSFAQKNIPSEVKTAFAKQYPNVTKVKWEKENGDFEAGFTIDKIENSVLLDAKGNILETEVAIKKATLSKEILAYVSKNYAGKKIKGAAKINSVKEGLIYEVEVDGKDVLFNETGKFLKESKD
jgi:Putative beta-lactamase-inhibitor-like, PepSY-like